MTIKSISHLAKEAYHYTKAHLLNSSQSAVKFAQYSNSDKHLKFAANMLSIKNKSLEPSGKNYQKKLEKNHKLSSHLSALSFRRSDKYIPANSKMSRELTKAIINRTQSQTVPAQSSLSDSSRFVDQLQIVMGTKQ